jgi:DNA replication protein DnaC
VEYDDEDHRDRLGPKPVRTIKAEEMDNSNFGRESTSQFSWNNVGEPLKTTIKNHIAQMHETEALGYGLFFHGVLFGHGKTSLAIQCAIQAMSRGAVGGYFYEPYDLHMIFTQPWNYLTTTGKPIAQKIQEVQILVLDEVGEEVTLEKNRPWFKKLIRHRYNKRLVTYITSNAGPSFYVKVFPWFDAIQLERFQAIEVKDKCHRDIATQQKHKKLKEGN